jgi:hypothetical protein
VALAVTVLAQGVALTGVLVVVGRAGSVAGALVAGLELSMKLKNCHQ